MRPDDRPPNRPRLSTQEVERVARATRAALRALLRRLEAKLLEIEARPEPWAAKWVALKLSARRTLEEHEASYRPIDVIAAETARAMLAEIARLEAGTASPLAGAGVRAAGAPPAHSQDQPQDRPQAHWHAIKRWLGARAVLHDAAG
jgi:hypothetical protein